jgi:hypothetical protein
MRSLIESFDLVGSQRGGPGGLPGSDQKCTKFTVNEIESWIADGIIKVIHVRLFQTTLEKHGKAGSMIPKICIYCNDFYDYQCRSIFGMYQVRIYFSLG